MHCSKCNSELTAEDTICPSCGAFVSEQAPAATFSVSENTYSGATSSQNGIPDSIKKWNWGAFSLSVFWGVGNYTYLPLLCLIPIFNIAWVFVCGIKGNEWAYASGKFDSLEDFIATQETWNRAGLAFFIIQIILFFYGIFSWVPVLTALLSNISI